MLRDILTGRCALPSFAAAVALVVAASVTNGGCSASQSRPRISAPEWKSPIARDHALVGKVWAVARAREIDLVELSRALERADFVLLGEQHDNADHHRLQADLLAAMLAAGRKPAVAFEQIDLEQQAAVDAVLDSAPWPGKNDVPKLATRVAKAANWEKSGWPPFAIYRPVFETAIAAGVPVRAANLSRSTMASLFTSSPMQRKGGGKTVAVRDAGLLADVPLSDEARASLAADIEESHCGYASDDLVGKMVEAQRRRDAVMADAMTLADSRAAWKGTVLIAGFGHARKDYGVPLYLRRIVPNRSIVSVGLLEVRSDGAAPEDYAAFFHAVALPFDYVVFTPRADDADPCEKFRGGLEKLKKKR